MYPLSSQALRNEEPAATVGLTQIAKHKGPMEAMSRFPGVNNTRQEPRNPRSIFT